jgi:hypothetical protein
MSTTAIQVPNPTGAPGLLTVPPDNTAAILKFQNDCLRQRKYIPLGWIQRIVLERTNATYIPSDMEEDLKSDPGGISIEFFGQENWLPIGQVETAGFQSFLLPLAPVVTKDGYAGFPDKPDRHWAPSKPPENIRQEDGSYKTIREEVRMVKQPLRLFSSGILRGTNFAIYERVAQILVKAQGIAEGWILRCGYNPVEKTHMAFLVDRTTGEAHFYGGLYDISKPGQM